MNTELVEKYTLALTKLKELGALDILPEYKMSDFYYEVYWSKFFQLDYSSIIAELNEFETLLLKKLQGMFSMWLSSEGEDRIYCPMYVSSDGKRSFSLEYLDNEFLQALYNQAESLFTQPIMLSRLYDIIWVRKGIEQKSLYEAGKRAFQYYKIFCEELLNVKNYHVAYIIVPRLRALAFGLGKNFKGREDYCDYILKFLDYSVSDDTLFFLYQTWKIIFEIRWGKDESRILTQLYQVIEKCVNHTNLSWQERLTNLLGKICRRLNLEEKQRDILEKMAERYIYEANQPNYMVKIHFLSRAVDTYRKIKGYPHKGKVTKLLEEIQKLQPIQGSQFKEFKYSIDISEEVEKVLSQYKDKDFQNCIVGLWANKRFFPNKEEMEKIIKEYPKSILAEAVTTSYQNHLGQTVKIGGNDFSDYQNRKMYRELILDIHIMPLLDLINERFFFTEQGFQDLFFSNPFIPEGYEKLFTKGVYYFIKKMFIEASCILVPLLENSLRYVISETNPTINKKDNIEVFQNKIEMSELIQRAIEEHVLDESILYHLAELLNDPRNNVRNYIAHGLYPSDFFYSSDIILVVYLIFVLSLDKIFYFKK